MRSLSLLLLGALVSLGSCNDAEWDAAASGDEPPPAELPSNEQISHIHKTADKDKNGKLSMEEVKSFTLEVRRSRVMSDVDNILHELDADHDSKVTLEEFVDKALTGIKNPSEAMTNLEKAKFKAADTNGDGYLERVEIPGVLYPELHDGVLDVTTAHVMKERDQDGDGQLDLREFLKTDGATEADFKQLDKDVTGKLDMAELKHWESGFHHTEAEFEQLFAVADKDGDKHVTAEEMHAARDAMTGTDIHMTLADWADHLDL